jgi:predicted enzyme related to lactoylglutathione lyase
MGISMIQLLSMPVSDQDRAKEFYVGVLGMDLVQDVAMGPDMRWVQVRPKGAETSIALVTWFPSMPPGSSKGLVLETPDLEATIAELATRGLAIVGAIDEQPWGRFVSFSDPDENWIILQTTTN